MAVVIYIIYMYKYNIHSELNDDMNTNIIQKGKVRLKVGYTYSCIIIYRILMLTIFQVIT